jgi:hypothetical protein
MPFKVQVGHRKLFVSEPEGRSNWPSEKGSAAIYASGEPWELLNGGSVGYYRTPRFRSLWI